jgi:hypothetical protein
VRDAREGDWWSRRGVAPLGEYYSTAPQPDTDANASKPDTGSLHAARRDADICVSAGDSIAVASGSNVEVLVPSTYHLG